MIVHGNIEIVDVFIAPPAGEERYILISSLDALKKCSLFYLLHSLSRLKQFHSPAVNVRMS